VHGAKPQIDGGQCECQITRRFMHVVQIPEVEEDRIPKELIPTLLSRDQRAIKDKLDELVSSTKLGVRDLFIDDETNLHESLHLVQAVIYPFMRWYSILVFRQMLDVFKGAKETSLSLHRAGATSFGIPSFMLLDLDYYIWDTSKRFLSWTYKHQLGISLSEETGKGQGVPLIRLNTTDLLENAASLIQCKISTGKDFPKWIEFDRWSKRNPAYTRIIDFWTAPRFDRTGSLAR
jgi:hypothetical protein